MAESNEEKCKWTYTFSLIRELSIIKIRILHKLINRFNVIPIKIQASFL